MGFAGLLSPSSVWPGIKSIFSAGIRRRLIAPLCPVIHNLMA